MKQKGIVGISLFFCMLGMIGYGILDYYGYIPHRTYQASDFGITTVKSPYDQNGNGIDDFSDIVLGARKDVKAKPHYKSAYYAGGYPKEGEGVCTDLVWRALKEAGYLLKDLVDMDIRNHPEYYAGLDSLGDENINFRRVSNLYVYMQHNLLSLTLDLKQIDEWQPGDIVIFGTHGSHIGIVSDKRNKKGIPYLLHNGGQPNREENVMERLERQKTIVGHFRFLKKDGTKLESGSFES